MKVLLLIVAFLLWAGIAQAGNETLSWDAIANATSYEIHQSIDAGATWTVIATPASSVCTAGRCTAVVNLPATGLVLVRFAAKNAVGVTVRYGAGVWHCESCMPPLQTANVGVQ